MKTYAIIIICIFLSPILTQAKGWNHHTGSYEVPVDEQELREFAAFPLEDLRTRSDDGHLEIKYTLPLELTGEPIEVHISEYEDRENMSCSKQVCSVRYPNLKLDRAKVENFLSTQGLSSFEFGARMKVFSDFLIDPQGFVIFKEKEETN